MISVIHLYATFIMWTCILLFFLRVIGQVYVALYQPRWLPPMKQWYSGLIPYGILLPMQILILMWMTTIGYDFSRQTGYFWAEDRIIAERLVALSVVYFVSMVVRYILRMTRYPEQRWSGGTIPIVLHCVLAVFIFVVSSPPLTR